MDLPTLVLIAIALGIDAFAVSLSAGAYLVRADARQTFRLSFHFGLFQFLMPILGWLAGAELADVIKEVDHWVAFGLLAVIGGKMIKESLNVTKTLKKDVTRGWSLVALSVATSIDALAIGFSLSLIGTEIVVPAVLIGIVASLMSLAGVRLGERVSGIFGRRVEFVGGAVLVLIGARILFEHTLLM
jgi:putative Mn2+ efflux pump MntP